MDATVFVGDGDDRGSSQKAHVSSVDTRGALEGTGHQMEGLKPHVLRFFTGVKLSLWKDCII